MRAQEHPSNYHAAAEFPSTFVNIMSVSETFRQLSIRQWTFRQLPSTSCLFVENTLCGSWTFRLTSDNFLCGRGNFRLLLLTIRASEGISVQILCVSRTFNHLP